MQTFAKGICRALMVLAVSALVASCASNGEANAPDPGSKKWYEQRTQEIETAKADGKLSEEEYLKLKSEADATRQEYIDARNDSTSAHVGFGLEGGVGSGRTHGGPGAQRPGSKP